MRPKCSLVTQEAVESPGARALTSSFSGGSKSDADNVFIFLQFSCLSNIDLKAATTKPSSLFQHFKIG